MKVKIFSVRADENFRAIRIGEETGKLSANEYLEDKIQKFLDENPKSQIKHVQFSTWPTAELCGGDTPSTPAIC